MPFFAKAAIDALKEHPSLNATIDTEKGEVTYYDRENLAIAVDTERGLLTPVIKEAGDLSIAGLARKIARRRGAHPDQQDHPRRAVRRHLHDHQHRAAAAHSSTPRSSTSRRSPSSAPGRW